MKKELLEKIYYHRNVASVNNFSKEEFYLALEMNPEGQKNVMEIWDEDHEEKGFPQDDLSLLAYYHILLEMGVLTQDQYQRLLQKETK